MLQSRVVVPVQPDPRSYVGGPTSDAPVGMVMKRCVCSAPAPPLFVRAAVRSTRSLVAACVLDAVHCTDRSGTDAPPPPPPPPPPPEDGTEKFAVTSRSPNI